MRNFLIRLLIWTRRKLPRHVHATICTTSFPMAPFAAKFVARYSAVVSLEISSERAVRSAKFTMPVKKMKRIRTRNRRNRRQEVEKNRKTKERQKEKEKEKKKKNKLCLSLSYLK